MKSRVMWIALAAASLAALGTSCGGDDGDSKAEPVEEAPELPEGAVQCGGTTCEPEDWFQGELCCRSAFDGTCGQTVGGTCVDLPQPPDERCESGKFSGMGQEITINSCCNEDTNECGLRFEFGGQSMCTSITQAMRFGRNQMVMGGNMMVQVQGTLPEAKTCDGDPIETPAATAGSGG